jgi:predicted membrane GTPase involved in stress response
MQKCRIRLDHNAALFIQIEIIDGVETECEPFETVDITVPNEYTSSIVDSMNK